jgi:hypothetical protein
MTIANTGSLSAGKSNIWRPLVHPGGGRWLFTRRLAMQRQPRIRNATARTAQPKPTELNKFFSIRGKQIPPTDEPETVIPVARPRFFRNQVLTAMIPVWKLLLVL